MAPPCCGIIFIYLFLVVIFMTTVAEGSDSDLTVHIMEGDCGQEGL